MTLKPAGSAELQTGESPLSIAVVIVAAGRGTRLGDTTPKQYIPLRDRCSLRRAVEAFLPLESVRWILPVIHAADTRLFADAMSGLRDPRLLPPVTGGETRAVSVRRGLERLEACRPDLVLIHDAARPFVTLRVISDVISGLEASDGACAALPIVDAIWRSEDMAALEAVPREGLWRAQTPQGFRFASILEAHRHHAGSGADDVAVAREAGLNVRFVAGSEQNYKITTRDDLRRAISDATMLDASKDRLSVRAV